MKLFLLSFVVLTLLLNSCDQRSTTEEYLQSGQDYLNKKEWNSAIIEYKNAVKQSPDNAQARALLGHAYVDIYSSHAAIKELKRAIDLGYEKNLVSLDLGKAYDQLGKSEDILKEIKINNQQTSSLKADIHALRARAFMRQSKFDQAKQELAKARGLNDQAADVRLAWALYEKGLGNAAKQRQWLEPLLKEQGGNADAWSQMGEIEQNAENLEAAEKAFSRAISLRNLVHVDYIRRALLKIAQKNYDGASEDINAVKKTGTQWPMIGHAEGVIAYQQKQFDQAQGHFEKVLSKFPDYQPSRLLIGMTHFNKANFQNAATHLEQYLGFNPEADQASYFYAASLMKLGRIKDSVKILKKLSISHPEDIKILSMLGGAYISTKNLESGIQLLQKAISIDPKQAALRLQLGTALLSTVSQREQGEKEIIKAIELDPALTGADVILYSSYMRGKKFDSARNVAQKLASRQSKKSVGDNLFALTYVAENYKKKAVKLLKKTLVKFPADPLTSDNLARIYLQQNQLAMAKDLYSKVLTIDPGHLKSLNQMALISARENNPQEVINWLKKATELNPELLSAKLQLAAQYLRQNKAKLALQALQDVNETGKQSPGYILLQAKAKMEVKEYQHAIRALKALVSKQPKLPAAHILLAQAYGHQNNPAKMRKSLEETLKIVPELLHANLIMAKLDMFEGKADDFKKRVAVLIKKYPDNKDVQFLSARVESSKKDYKYAIKTLSSLMKTVPHQDVVIDLARNQWQSGDKEGAISGLELWIQQHEDDSRVLLLLAQYYQEDNKLDEARKTYQVLNKTVPNNLVVLNNLAWLMIDTDPAKGIEYAEQAIKVNPKNPFIQDTLAMLYLENGEREKALKHSSKAVKVAPGHEDIQYNHTKILIANNRKRKAKKILSELLKTASSYDKREMIRKDLGKL